MTTVYVHYLNIQRFERLLALETDPEKRILLQQLLAEERAKDPGDPTAKGRAERPTPRTP